MSVHSGSSAMAHNLDRFDFHSDFEMIAAEAARLKVEPGTGRFYRDRYGDEPVVITVKGLASQLPAYEFHIRRWVLGERIRFDQQVANVAT